MADKALKKLTQPYDYGDYMTKALNNYISNRISFKSSNKELSDKYAEEINKLSMIFKTKENRLKVLYMSIFAEIDWLRENDPVKYKEQEYNLYSAKSILMDQANSVHREFSFSYRLWNTIKDAPFSEGSTTEKAIKYYIKNQKKRTGKDSPIDEMIKNDILITPFLGYSTYLTRNNMTIWEYAKTVIPNIRVLDGDEVSKNVIKNEDERIHQGFFPMIEYVYQHEKFNYISNRINRFGSNEERMKKREAEKEERRKEKTKAYINREMERAFKQHNKWTCLDYIDKLSVFPKCYREYISNNENIGNNWVILAVSKKKNGPYFHGYLNDLQKSPIGFTLKNPYIYKTMAEAKDAIDIFKKEGVILDGEPVCV